MNHDIFIGFKSLKCFHVSEHWDDLYLYHSFLPEGYFLCACIRWVFHKTLKIHKSGVLLIIKIMAIILRWTLFHSDLLILVRMKYSAYYNTFMWQKFFLKYSPTTLCRDYSHWKAAAQFSAVAGFSVWRVGSGGGWFEEEGVLYLLALSLFNCFLFPSVQKHIFSV